MVVGVILAVAAELVTPLIVIAESCEGEEQGVDPLPVQAILGGGHEIVLPLMLIEDVSAPVTVGVY